MSTAVATPAASLPTPVERHPSPRQYASIAPTSSPSSSSQLHEPAAKRARINASPEYVTDRQASNSNSPQNATSRSGPPPPIKVKREPGSPAPASSRPRPKRLDLSSSMNNSRSGPHTGRPSAPLTSRESAGLIIQDVGLACLSPGFATNDPGMREQLQRSLNVRDRQRMIIEARQKSGKSGSGSSADNDGPRTQDTTLFGVPTNGTRTPLTSRRKGPPAGLSIAAPPAAQFQNDRVIQSAPIHQTFTGLRPGEYPASRHAQHGPSGLGQTSHIHHVPATQTNNRLPPIADVFANDRLESRRYNNNGNSPNGHPPPVPSPGFPPSAQSGTGQPPLSARAREFRSAEEAVQGLSGGRDELMPKVVHYGGVQPPTPPSPMPGHLQDVLARTTSAGHLPSSRRRTREEFEQDNHSPPHSHSHERGREEEDWKRGMGSREKKEEFLRLCERAWDLFHS
ncbi:uncharacterized protein MYCGRDRAFT_69186 [Zymoseptoria tritici IPO323]|uniref:Uncharacterized protein n=1 Tax=Zymoseptoria tritici (strain CBS 115943 / IPO323) TaxID=336722 RepID=F9X501_ZYMTI|nr:uncharacterized protein MYCGRDRAFT_69186 [Zymoseptoria tritici IPO323]EGP90198.1 hypothetical protein MYCGRDRAFT_69186 [Zymoseptoria tritici IPO323]